MKPVDLRHRIDSLWTADAEADPDDVLDMVRGLFDALELGVIRAASPDDRGMWTVHAWVKRGILLAFRFSPTEPAGVTSFATFYDRSAIPPRLFTHEDGVRMVPGGSAVRRGAYVGKRVTIMPPAYMNVGAYVGDGSMVDSHALVGSCAQVGSNVHVSAAAQIGGVLEPVGALPVIVEDDVLVGGGCGVYEGVRIGKGAVLGAGLILTASTPVFDLVGNTIIRSDSDSPLVIPERAVVVPGTRRIEKGSLAATYGLGAACGLIVKYRDSSTDRRTALEGTLRI